MNWQQIHSNTRVSVYEKVHEFNLLQAFQSIDNKNIFPIPLQLHRQMSERKKSIKRL